VRKENPKLPNTSLCEELISIDNIELAIKKVKSNKGAAGIDGMTVYELKDEFDKRSEEIKSRILARTYRPNRSLRVQIPKDNGKMRMLGIPTVIDRTVQQAVVKVITPMFEETFSDFSYAYRPNRSAEDAVRQANIYMAEGYKYVVDLDLSKYFDTVNHDILMGLIDKTLEDKDIRRLIYSFLKAGAMENGFPVETTEGTPQGGVISPLLSNIYLTPFDKELEKRTIKFIRYADDVQMFSKSEMASRRIMRNAIKFLENKLKLKVNTEKTESRPARGSKMLGFIFRTSGYVDKANQYHLGYCVPREKAWDNFKDRIREITKRNRGFSVERVIRELNWFLRGWINYYGRSSISVKLGTLQTWIRRRVRQYCYKIWKTSKARKHHLRLLGCKEDRINSLFLSSSSYWKMSIYMNNILSNKIIHEELGLIDIKKYYKQRNANSKLEDMFYIALHKYGKAI
jgi:group II intron reverse transcriptase/maturase